MMKILFKQLKIAGLLLSCFVILTGFIYPGIVTGLAQWWFPATANGSLVTREGHVIGSMLIGQWFDGEGYFWGRPSATPLFPYNAMQSSSSNLGPSNPAFLDTIRQRITVLEPEGLDPSHLIPVDLVTASGSGLDPDISLAAAIYQIPRIAKARHLSETELKAMVEQFTQKKRFFILGEPRVNVLALNMALDQSW